MILADLGAEVIKVEPRGDGDKTRRLPGSGSGLFATFNRNKKSIQLDIHRCGRPGDVCWHCSTPPTCWWRTSAAERWSRTDWATRRFKARNPGIIYCSLKGFLPGPYGDRSALDEVVQMLGGLAYMTGPPGRPLRAGASVNDIMGGMFGVIGIQGALRTREVTGEGAHLTSSLFENNVFLVGNHMVQAQMTGEDVQPMPNRIPAWAVYDIFRTAGDDQIFVAAVSDTQFRSMCRAFGLDDLASDTSLSTNTGRVAAREAIHASLQRRLDDLSLEEIERICDEADLSCARVNTPSDLVDDPHLTSTGGLVDTATPGAGSALVPLLPLLVDGQRLGSGRTFRPLGSTTPRYSIVSGRVATDEGKQERTMKFSFPTEDHGSARHGGGRTARAERVRFRRRRRSRRR